MLSVCTEYHRKWNMLSEYLWVTAGHGIAVVMRQAVGTEPTFRLNKLLKPYFEVM
jgi:hypothetical protein